MRPLGERAIWSYIAVLRIMQAQQRDSQNCIYPNSLKLKFHIFRFQQLRLPAKPPSVALLAFLVTLFSFQGADPGLRPELNAQCA